MGDRLRMGIPSRYVTSQLGQLSLASLWGRLIEYQLRLGEGRECYLCRMAGNTVWFRVACEFRSGVATLRTAIHLLLSYLLTWELLHSAQKLTRQDITTDYNLHVCVNDIMVYAVLQPSESTIWNNTSLLEGDCVRKL